MSAAETRTRSLLHHPAVFRHQPPTAWNFSHSIRAYQAAEAARWPHPRLMPVQGAVAAEAQAPSWSLITAELNPAPSPPTAPAIGLWVEGARRPCLGRPSLTLRMWRFSKGGIDPWP